MPPTRIARTLERLRAGELPAPSGAPPTACRGLGHTCTGCGEVIGRFEQCYSVRTAHGASPLWLHPVCHETWIRFKGWPAPARGAADPPPYPPGRTADV